MHSKLKTQLRIRINWLMDSCTRMIAARNIKPVFYHSFFLHVFLLFTLTIFVTLLHSLAAGTFIPAKTGLPHVEKAAVVKFLRANGKFTVDENGKVLLFDNKIVSTKNLR